MITFPATVYKVQTLVDGGVRVTLDLPEDAIMQAAELMECKRAGVVLKIEATPVLQKETENGKVPTGDKRKSIRAAS
jgi:hypothetical protein